MRIELGPRRGANLGKSTFRYHVRFWPRKVFPRAPTMSPAGPQKEPKSVEILIKAMRNHAPGHLGCTLPSSARPEPLFPSFFAISAPFSPISVAFWAEFAGPRPSPQKKNRERSAPGASKQKRPHPKTLVENRWHGGGFARQRHWI